jgi:hypothetical protein
MCAATSSDEHIDHKKLAVWLDEYRDGYISEEAAAELSELIRARDDAARWIMDELAFHGTLSQTFHDVDQESFVRGFVERLAAEADPADAERIAKSSTTQARAIRDQQEESSLKATLASFFFGSGSDGAESATLPLRTILVAMLCIAGLIMFIRPLLLPDVVATLTDSTPGVVIHRNSARLLPEKSMRLRSGDGIRVPRDGSASLVLKDAVVVTVSNDSAVTLLAPGEGSNLPSLKLLAGELEGNVKDADGGALHVTTPHATAQSSEGRMLLSVTTASTRVESQGGDLTVIRQSDGERVIVPAAHYVIVVPGMPLKPAKL